MINAPITLFEIFPFIFLLTTQFFFYDLFKKDELNLLKTNGLKNTSILKVIFFLAILIGIFNIIIFYNFASNLKFYYSNIKNGFSNDNKYLAMVTQSGLWIKDEVDGKTLLTKSKLIKDNILFETMINEFNEDLRSFFKTLLSNNQIFPKNIGFNLLAINTNYFMGIYM